MLRRFLSVAPDSVWRSATSEERGAFARLEPWIWLVWLVWLAGPVFFTPREFPHWLWPTLLSVPAFLAAYVGAYVAPRRRMVWYAIAILVIGGAVTPVNPFAQTYAIYACAVGAGWGTARRSGALVFVLILAYTIEWFALRYPWESIINLWILCPIIAALIIGARLQRQHRADLRLSHDEIRRLAASAERERIGRDLHDLLGHTLSMVALKSELAGRLVERDPGAARHEMDEVARVARDALSQVRSAVRGIRAAALASELASARLLLETSGVQMEYWSDGGELPSVVETCLALVLREAVTNIERHACASRVEVSVIAGPERVVMCVRDDGRGGVDARGNGLTGMRERIVAGGGELLVESPHGGGTAIEVRLPLPPAGRGQVVRNAAGSTIVPLPQQAAGHRA